MDGRAVEATTGSVATGFVATDCVATGVVAPRLVAPGLVALGGAATGTVAEAPLCGGEVPTGCGAGGGAADGGVAAALVTAAFVTAAFVTDRCGATGKVSVDGFSCGPNVGFVAAGLVAAGCVEAGCVTDGCGWAGCGAAGCGAAGCGAAGCVTDGCGAAGCDAAGFGADGCGPAGVPPTEPVGEGFGEAEAVLVAEARLVTAAVPVADVARGVTTAAGCWTWADKLPSPRLAVWVPRPELPPAATDDARAAFCSVLAGTAFASPDPPAFASPGPANTPLANAVAVTTALKKRSRD